MVLAKFDDSISSAADGGTLFGDGWPLAHDWIGRGAGINPLDEDAFNPDLEQSSECETTHMATMNNWPNQGLDIFTDGQATHTCCIYTCNEVSIITVPRYEHVLMVAGSGATSLF